ncbi:hypothetical protein Bca4012_025310 [Brassica carinata]|uniref:Uncharacterized protein n=1 Tax=Brassica carinata TaxID=52824 RepID=A0A8X7VGE7_BRACI|nr:hypothetical protein Bca52824_022358 [Brassica carinata]
MPSDVILVVPSNGASSWRRETQSSWCRASARDVMLLELTIAVVSQAKVGFNSNIGRGLIDEVKSISAHYLVLSRPVTQAFRTSDEITRYVSTFAPSTFFVVLDWKAKKTAQRLLL